MSILSCAALACFLIGLAGQFTRRIRLYQCAGIQAIGDGFLFLRFIQTEHWLWAWCACALCAYNAWRWWRGGGDDDTRRRRRTLARAFTPVRRTAPQTT